MTVEEFEEFMDKWFYNKWTEEMCIEADKWIDLNCYKIETKKYFYFFKKENKVYVSTHAQSKFILQHLNKIANEEDRYMLMLKYSEFLAD